jgi:hypothetical protein
MKNEKCRMQNARPKKKNEYFMDEPKRKDVFSLSAPPSVGSRAGRRRH